MMRLRTLIFVAALLSLLPGLAYPQVTASVALTPQITSVPRIGVNLGTPTSYGAEQFSSNVIMNPGFEQNIDRAIVIVSLHDSAGFGDNAPYYSRPDGFWNGATFQVLTGTSVGVNGTIATSVAVGTDGNPHWTTSGAAPTLAVGDVISLNQTQATGSFPAAWWITNGSGTNVHITTADHHSGAACGELTLQAGSNTQVTSYLDSLGPTNFLPINGAWTLSFWAKATTGSPTLNAVFARNTGPATTFLNQTTAALTTTWTQFTYHFTAVDSSNQATLYLQFTASTGSGAIRLDDVSLSRDSDTTAWRGEVIGALAALHPGHVRYWVGNLGDTEANIVASAFTRATSRWQGFAGTDNGQNNQNFVPSLADFLALCAQIGAQPWIVVPTTFISSEWTALGTYLASAQTTYNFSEIVVEYGNENWNSVFRAAGILDGTHYGQAANTGFAALRAAAGSIPLHLEANSQWVSPGGFGQPAMAACSQCDGADIAPYYYSTMNIGDSNATAIAAMLNDSDMPSLISTLFADIPANKSVDVYEVNATTTQGTAPESQRDPIVAGAVSGTAIVSRILTALAGGVTRQAAFVLSQYNVATSNGNTELWGITRDLTSASSFRPTALAIEMLNMALPGDYYAVTATGTGASGITAAAFQSSAGWSMAVTSSNTTPTAISVASLPGNPAPLPTQALLLSAPAVTSSNDGGTQQVVIQRLPISSLTFSIPADGFLVLRWLSQQFNIPAGSGTFGSSAAFPMGQQIAAITANVSGRFTGLTCVDIQHGATCTTGPVVNVFDGTSNTGTALQCPNALQSTRGKVSSQAQTLPFLAGDVIGIYVSTQGNTCLNDVYSIGAQASGSQ